MRRAVLFAAAVFAAVVLPASPAAAHGSGGSDATNFQSRITANPAPADLEWEVIAGDSMLQLRNRSGREVIVEGYSGEPYLRFDADGGVFENRRSPATYVNRDRYGASKAPADVDADAPALWVRVADGLEHEWHDHRIHWMSTIKPPQVAAARGRTVEIQKWAVPYSIGATKDSVLGVLRYVPPRAWWPWLAGAGLALTAPAVAAVLINRNRLSVRRLARTGAGMLAALTVIDAVHLWDDLVAVPATVSENIGAVAYGGLFLVVAAVAAAAGWRAKQTAMPLVLGALALVFGYGVTHTAQLASSQLATVLPPWFTRALVASNLALAIPVALLVITAERRFGPRTAAVTAEDT